jgi:hypothetical protein
MEPDSSRLTAIDAAVIAAVSLAICTMSQHLWFMTLFVILAIAVRFWALYKVAAKENISMVGEGIFFTICAVVGAAYDWNAVAVRSLYFYLVPNFFPTLPIPVWMMLYWGMILRGLARFARWRALSPPPSPAKSIGISDMRIDAGWLKVIAELAIMFLAGRAIGKLYMDPILSWLPFAAGLGIYLILFPPEKHDLKLLMVGLFVCPAIEIAYVRTGDLYKFYLDDIYGAPVWLFFWWMLAILTWKDLAFRMERLIGRVFGGARGSVNS